jgi:hypothetical protein
MSFTIFASSHSLRLWANNVSKRHFFLRTYTCMSLYIIPTRERFLTFLTGINAFFALWLWQFYTLFAKKLLSINATCCFSIGAFILTLWKKQKLYHDMQCSWALRHFAALNMSPLQILLQNKEVRWHFVPARSMKHINLHLISVSKY